MEVRGIHHLGVAVANLEEAVATYQRLLGARVESREMLTDQGVSAASVLVGGDRIELLEPTGDDTPVGRFISSRGPGLHHVAYAVPDVAAMLRELESVGAELIDTHPRRGLYGLQIAFVHPHAVHGVLTEVVSGG
jgi:methylmalonyl-CoA/ethylmalonyl-CoA epimerase